MEEDEDRLIACPRCGAEVYWVPVARPFDEEESREHYAMCTRCTWGED